jgi:hypothetical protein
MMLLFRSSNPDICSGETFNTVIYQASGGVAVDERRRSALRKP